MRNTILLFIVFVVVLGIFSLYIDPSRLMKRDAKLAAEIVTYSRYCGASPRRLDGVSGKYDFEPIRMSKFDKQMEDEKLLLTQSFDQFHKANLRRECDALRAKISESIGKTK